MKRVLDEIHAALTSISDGVLPQDAIRRVFDIINRERQGRKWCADCAATATACGTFLDGWLDIRHEPDCEWAAVFAPLGEHLIFKGNEAASVAINSSALSGQGFTESEKSALASIAAAFDQWDQCRTLTRPDAGERE